MDKDGKSILDAITALREIAERSGYEAERTITIKHDAESYRKVVVATLLGQTMLPPDRAV